MRFDPIDVLSSSKRGKSFVKLFCVREFSDLPFYCHPLKLFLFTWILMLAALSFHVSYVSYPSMGLPLGLFILSAIGFLWGYSGVHASFLTSKAPQRAETRYVLNLQRLRRVNGLFALLALAIMLLNYKIDGLPPALGFFSFDTAAYLEYGRFKQLLFPLLVCLFVNAFLDSSWSRRFTFSGFALLAMLLYVTRGNILTALLQVLLVFSMRAKVSRRKLYLIAIIIGTTAAVAADLIGNSRTPQAIFFLFLHIKTSFFDWPMMYLWAIAYFSVPLSNMCWIVKGFHFSSVTLSFLYPTLPAFWTPIDPYAKLLNSGDIVDGVHTYLANYYLDFSFPGLLLVNVLIGACSGLLVRYGIARRCLTSAVFLSCIAYIFFMDNFTPLSTILQFAMQLFVQRYILSGVRRDQRQILPARAVTV